MHCCEWREKLETNLPSTGHFDDGWGFHYQHGKVHYLNAWLTAESLKEFMREMLLTASLVPIDCPTGLRLRALQAQKNAGDGSSQLHFACNYGPGSIDLLNLQGLPDAHKTAMERNLLIGRTRLDPAEFALWRA